jgi:Zn-dependent peptidase ImmA (M78 family)
MRLLAKAAEVGRVSAHLLRQLEQRESPIAASRKVVPVRGRPEPWRQGYELGERARERLVPGGKPIESVQASFESLDIHVAVVHFESDDIEAASLYEPGASPIVLLSEMSERVRREISRRAILAHELCHLLHDAGERDLLASISREHDHAPIEMRANGFAPSFLAPKAHVSAVGATPREVVKDLAYTWGFTLEGATWHAKNLKLISQDDATELVNERRTATLQPSCERPIRRLPVDVILESAEASPLTRGLVSDLAMRALAEGIISRGRAREILTMR